MAKEVIKNCKTDKQIKENMSSNKTYTISEAKFVKLVILAICDDVADGFNEFELLEENDRFVKQMIGQIYGKDTGYTNKILEFVELIPEIEKKYLFIAALYEEIMLSKDIISASLIYDAVNALKSLEHYSDLENTMQTNVELMLKVLEMLIAYFQNESKNNGDKIVLPLPIIQHQKGLKEMQENMDKIQKQVAKLEELVLQMDLDKIVSACNYTSAQLDAIKEEKEIINEWDQQITLWKEKNFGFENILDMANKFRDFEINVFRDNKKLVQVLKSRIPDDVKWLICKEGIKIKNAIGNYLHGYMNGSKPALHYATKDASKWLFETNINGKGMFLKSITADAYLYITFENEVKIMSKTQNLDNFYWTIQYLGNNKYDIINVGTKQGFSLNVEIYNGTVTIQLANSSEWIFEN